MQVNPINNYSNRPVNNQTNFRGQIILKGAREVVSSRAVHKPIDFMTISSERIEQIIGKTVRTAEDLKERKAGGRSILSDGAIAAIITEDNKYKTIIKMVSGDVYEVPYKAEEVSGAKKLADGDISVIEPTGMDTFLQS